MKSIWQRFKIHESVYLLLLIALISGYIKNSLIILLIVIVHELGHIGLGLLFNYKISRVVIYPFGGVTSVDKLINSSINQEIIVVMGGIINQILLYFLMRWLFNLNFIYSGTWELFKFYNRNIMLFNLLPIIPLDGSLLIKLLLEKYVSYKLAYKMYLVIGVLSISIFILKSKEILINNLMVFTFLGFKIYESFKNYPYLYQKFLLERYLYDLDYKKIKYEKNFNKLGKEKYYFFKNGEKILSEKKILANLFDRRL